MKVGQLFPNKYMSKEDVPDPVTLVIADCLMESIEFDGTRDVKPMIQWTDEQTKPMILNRANAAVIASAYGDDTEQWAGKPVTVYVDGSVMYMGRMVGGLRVRVPQAMPAGKKSNGGKGKIKDAPADDAPF